MRVSLQIDGDASGAVKASQDASAAVSDLGKTSGLTADQIAKLQGGIGNVANAGAAAGAANDNLASTFAGLAGKIGDLASKTLGAGNSFSKAAGAAGSLAEGVGGVVRSAGGLSILTGGIGLATTAATVFYDVANRGASDAAKRLDDQARLIGTVRDAYSGAGKAAGAFLLESKNVTLFLMEGNQKALQDDLAKAATGAVKKFNFDSTIADITNQQNVGEGGGVGSINDAEVKSFQALKGAYNDYTAAVNGGLPALEKLKETLTNIGRSGDTGVAALARSSLKDIKSATDDLDEKIKRGQAAINKQKGIATEKDDALLGTSSQLENFERFLKSAERQAAAQEAEAAAVGGTAGALAKLRSETVLGEAAQQAGAGAAEKYADQIAKIAARAGEAAQKLAVASLQSTTAFNRDQLGRNTIDASVADQLKGAFGNNADQNSEIAGAIRFNETMKDLKATTLDLSTGAFRDFRSEIAAGKTELQALGTVGVNALDKIINKLGDKILDNGISALVGAFTGGGSGAGGLLSRLIGGGSVANGGIVLGGPSGPGLFAAAGGGSFGPGWGVVGEKGPEIIKVHAGGVTVFPNQVSRPYLPGFADGGSLSPGGNVMRFPSGAAPQTEAIQVTVNSYGTPQKVEAQQVVDGRGNRRIELTLSDQMAAATSRPGSSFRTAMLNNYGARTPGVKR